MRQREKATALDMLHQFLAELWPDRHEACFEELRVLDGDDLLSQVDVLQGQAKCLANPHAASIQQQEERTVHYWDLRAVPNPQDRRRFQQTA
jgi:hypothetical protein